MSQSRASAMLWRRLDPPGHDACRLVETTSGWKIDGTAVFRDPSGPAVLAYHVAGDAGWRTREAWVRGWIGEQPLDVAIVRAAAAWLLDGVAVAGLEDCVDVDLGFTPATNLIAIRRLALVAGDAADAPAAWLDLATRKLERLAQRYQRRGETAYWYEAPAFGYAAELEVGPDGFVRRYPGLWEAG
jgi:hypothetical protein